MSLFKTAFAAGLLCTAHAALADDCHYQKVAELPLDGISVQGSINGEKVAMALSTGSTMTNVSRRWVDAHHLPLDSTGNYVPTTAEIPLCMW